ncbi:MAG TPA: helix-turn-helix transcriptional regulator [Mycobacteriales bacterium]|nr:helix-turn-helix transcriptional regulator [Mycobacteriales bacterium]
MNTTEPPGPSWRAPERPDPARWDEPDMRAVLADRDITRIYRMLQTYGYSQQHIAALTGQSQPEVSAIIHGRKVMGYDLLERIAEGLGFPRGYAGLAYYTPDHPHHHRPGAVPNRPPVAPDDHRVVVVNRDHSATTTR